VLVTGASGFLGRHLVRFLDNNGLTIRAAARKPADISSSPAVAAVEMPDLMHEPDWQPLLTGVETVIHLAGIAHRTASDEEHDRGNHRAVRSLSEAARQCGVQHLVFVSSIAAQTGPSSNVVLDETSAPAPTTAYGRAKLAAEEAVRASGVPFTILRPVVVHGEDAKGNYATVAKVARMPLPLPFGALTNRRSMLSIDNFNAAILTTITIPAARNEIFVVADPRPVTIGDVVSDIRARMNRAPWLLPVPPALLEAALRIAGKHPLWEHLNGSMIVDSAKLQAIGWCPQDPQKTAKTLP
jgi:UDP-glucose 4-epimerase